MTSNVHIEPLPRLSLLGDPPIAASDRARLVADFERFGAEGLPLDLDDYVRDAYGIDLSSTFGGQPIKNPWGKASGQLSLSVHQVQEDVDAGLGFVVLKTVIATDAENRQSMHEWAIKETRMTVEPIVGLRSGLEGWTVTWKGRGWWQSFDEYLVLVEHASRIARQAGIVVAPSCKYHLPAASDELFREEEYNHSTRRMCEAHRDGDPVRPLVLEKDFSPTLAGSDLAANKQQILNWLAQAPRLIRQGARPVGPIRLGIKLFNALFEDEFQLEMLAAVAGSKGDSRPDFITYANRLFRPASEPGGGVAYGGPDLSDRNLAVLDAYRDGVKRGSLPPLNIPISATGNINTGRMALEYALRGCSSFQIHTFFQLPNEAYPMTAQASKVSKALHLLYFHPREGLLAWIRPTAEKLGLVDADGVVRFAAIPQAALRPTT